MKPETTADINRLSETIQSLLALSRERGFFPSAVVSVFDEESTLARLTIGPTEPGTVYDVASLTKLATATQILMLVESGRVRLGDSIAALLPALAEDEWLRGRLGRVSVFSLLTHTSGIADWYPFYAEEGPFERVLRIALERTSPAHGMVYSDINFMLLGKLLEQAHGQPLEKCLQENLVRPLGLGRLTYAPDKAWRIAPSCYGNPIEESMCAERRITFCGWRPHAPVIGEANDGNAFYYFSGAAGSAGVFADVEAYQRLCQFHMRSQSPLFQIAEWEHAPTRGLGWQLGPMYPKGCGHTGFTGTSVYFSRCLGIGAVAFTNRLYYPEQNKNQTNEFRRALHEMVAAFAGNRA